MNELLILAALADRRRVLDEVMRYAHHLPPVRRPVVRDRLRALARFRPAPRHAPPTTVAIDR